MLNTIIATVTIKTFRCACTKALWQLHRVLRFAGIERAALRTLTQLDLACCIEDLRAASVSRIEQLRYDGAGWWSLGISDQFRVRFHWNGRDAEDVEIVDCH